MRKLLLLHNISTVQYLDNSNVERTYAYTDKMLANDVFIEYYSVGDLETEENVEEMKEDVENDSIPDYGSQLSVIMKYKHKYYQFLMFHNAVEIGSPVILLQTIVFLVNLISTTSAELLVDYLTDLSTEPLIPHLIEDSEFRNAANGMLRVKVKTIHELIQEHKADLN